MAIWKEIGISALFLSAHCVWILCSGIVEFCMPHVWGMTTMWMYSFFFFFNQHASRGLWSSETVSVIAEGQCLG